MPPKTYRLFISYRAKDAAQVDQIAHSLRLLTHEDGTARYQTWQDKHDLPAGVSHWWDEILDAIEASDLFVFHLTLESLKSEVCRAELDYAYQLNLPILVVVLDGAYRLDEESGGYRLPKETQALIPSWLGNIHWLFYTGAADFFIRFQQAVEHLERQWPPRTPAKRPLHPGSDQIHQDPYHLYDEACERAYKLDFKEADRLFRELVRRNMTRFVPISTEWLEILGQYQELIMIDSRSHVDFMFEEAWASYRRLFPKKFLKGDIFDPKGFATREIPPPPPIVTRVKETPPLADVTMTPLARPVTKLPVIIKINSKGLMPKPFAWIEIPGGQGTMQTNEVNVTLAIPTQRYWIAKYPVTNAQYAIFINDGGYQERQWWTEHGWQVREKENWKEPRYWRESPWNIADHPVVGVSWYEAVAFCLWLSEKTGEQIMLPTEAQWQYAAQGKDGRAYPWGKKHLSAYLGGNEWDCKRCNNSVDPCKSSATTPVTRYEGKGDSPFGVVDMAGNVGEWCLSDYSNHGNNINEIVEKRVLRGGAWYNNYTNLFRCDYRYWTYPHDWYFIWGFRPSLSLLGSEF